MWLNHPRDSSPNLQNSNLLLYATRVHEANSLFVRHEKQVMINNNMKNLQICYEKQVITCHTHVNIVKTHLHRKTVLPETTSLTLLNASMSLSQGYNENGVVTKKFCLLLLPNCLPADLLLRHITVCDQNSKKKNDSNRKGAVLRTNIATLLKHETLRYLHCSKSNN